MYFIHVLTTQVYFLPRLFSEFAGVVRKHAYQREKAFQNKHFFHISIDFQEILS
jgi:hypothetical protein